MSAFFAAVAVVAGMGVLAAFLLLPARWLAYGYTEARATLIMVRQVLQDESSLASSEAKGLDQALMDLTRDLRHRRLRGHVEAVLREYRKALASEPGPWIWVLGSPETELDRRHRARVQLQRDHVGQTLEEIEASLQLMRKVERFTRLQPKP